MSKARKYYAIIKITANNLAHQNIFTVKGDRIVEDNEVSLTIGHSIAFKTKAAAIKELSKAPAPSMLTIMEFYLILDK